ncbi:alpha/beta-hydrolase [Abortiporus biennis]|nr:alpha/beta-hydrolase [Abortiporus biennis]
MKFLQACLVVIVFSCTIQGAQVPLGLNSSNVAAIQRNGESAFKQGSNVLSPPDLIEAPRPGAGVANDAGDLVLVHVSKYSLKEKKNYKSIFITPIESPAQPLEIPLTQGGEAFWLDTRTIAHAVDEGEGKDKVKALYAVSVRFESNINSDETAILSILNQPTLIGKFPTAGVTNFKYTGRSGVLVFSEKVYPDGDLKTVKQQDEDWENRDDSALAYDRTPVRDWDFYIPPKKNSLFSVKLIQDPDHHWHLGQDFINLLNGTSHTSPIGSFGDASDFDVSQTHLVYRTPEPGYENGFYLKGGIYLIRLDGKSWRKQLSSGSQNATQAPIFNAQGDKVAFLESSLEVRGGHKNKIVIYDLERGTSYSLLSEWDRSPSSIKFSPDGNYLYLNTADVARDKVFVIPIQKTPSKKSKKPTRLTDLGSVSSIQALPSGRLLFTRSSFTSPNDVFVIRGLDEQNLQQIVNGKQKDVEKHIEIEQITRFSEDALESKDLSEGEEFWFKGAEGRRIHGWVLKPPGFNKGEKKKWPAVLLIHGGPAGSWQDQWSTRWNPNVFAGQGYVTVAIDPTGSTSYGMELTNAIRADWGGAPFVDLSKGWKHILKKYPEIDTDRLVGAGASYGGYAINWIQGHPEFDFGFKAVVCHDGVLDLRYLAYSTDITWFANEFAGVPWDHKIKKIFAKNNPIEFIDKWSIPQLTIHGSKDYRVVESDGLAAFQALQEREITSRLVIFPDENHWVLKQDNSLRWHKEVFSWFDLFVGKSD